MKRNLLELPGKEICQCLIDRIIDAAQITGNASPVSQIEQHMPLLSHEEIDRHRQPEAHGLADDEAAGHGGCAALRLMQAAVTARHDVHRDKNTAGARRVSHKRQNRHTQYDLLQTNSVALSLIHHNFTGEQRQEGQLPIALDVLLLDMPVEIAATDRRDGSPALGQGTCTGLLHNSAQ